MKYEMQSEKIDWSGTVIDVVKRIYAIRQCWEASEKQNPDLHEKLVEDIYMPSMVLLAQFVMSVKIDDEEKVQ